MKTQITSSRMNSSLLAMFSIWKITKQNLKCTINELIRPVAQRVWRGFHSKCRSFSQFRFRISWKSTHIQVKILPIKPLKASSWIEDSPKVRNSTLKTKLNTFRQCTTSFERQKFSPTIWTHSFWRVQRSFKKSWVTHTSLTLTGSSDLRLWVASRRQ